MISGTMYFDLLHKNASSHIKWNGKISANVIRESIGNRQGGYSSANEWQSNDKRAGRS